MATKTKPDAAALIAERGRRHSVGETLPSINADFEARGIDPRTLGPVGSPRTAGEPVAGVTPEAGGDRAALAAPPPTEAEIRAAAADPYAMLRVMVRDTAREAIDRVLGPTLTAWEDVRDAVDDLDDDAALGKHVRWIVRGWATVKVDQALAAVAER